MRKGLTQTLMAVAVAIMAMQAMAMAPVILDIPSPIVGNAENVTPANGFVYPDAIDLTKYVSDLESDSTQIIWSYTTATTPKYRINNVDAMDLGGGDNPVSPGAKALNNAVTGGEADTDGVPLTITIRNVDLSPIIGQAGTEPGTPGILAGETQAVTLFASDETTYSMKSVWFYTDDQGNDRLSPGVERVYPSDGPITSTAGYRWAQISAATVAHSNGSGLQFCHTAVQGQNNAATWKSPYGTEAQSTLPLVANSAYRIRVMVTSSQTNVDADPYWDLTVNNFDQISSTFYGGNGYGANFFFLSNVGGANAAVSGTPKEFVFWWTPSCVSTARWNDTSETQPGPFAPSNVDNKNAFIEFRLLQDPSNGGTNGATSFGTLCMQDLTIDRADLSAMQTLTASTPTYNLTSITSSAVTTGVSNITVSFASGAVTLTPTAGGSGSGSALVTVNPGDGNVDYLNENATIDDYPCPMDNQTLYLVSMDLSAPTQNDMDHPPAIFWVGADSLTNELICLSYVTPVNFWHHAGPGLTPETYKAFFYSNYGTNHGNDPTFSWYSIFRPRFMMGNNPDLGGGETKVGGVKISRIRVDKVQF